MADKYGIPFIETNNNEDVKKAFTILVRNIKQKIDSAKLHFYRKFLNRANKFLYEYDMNKFDSAKRQFFQKSE